MRSGFRLWSNSPAGPRIFQSSCNPLRKIGKNGRSRSSCQDSDSDGAAALEPIKEAGGLVFAQEFQTAEQPDMPHSAVKTGCVDWLLSPAEIAAQLGRIGKERALIKK